MAKRNVDFQHKETKAVFKLFSHFEAQGQDRGRVFNDWLTAICCCLSLGREEERYLEVAKRYSKGEKGKRGIDVMAQAFAELVNAMETSGADILGDFFQGAITYGEHGQFFTPEPVCEMMAQTTIGENPPEKPDGEPFSICDPACGSGRTLLAAAKLVPNAVLYGVDVDERCTKMTAINLALNGLRGFVVHGNSLSLQEHGHYSVSRFIPGALQWRTHPILTVPMVEQPEQAVVATENPSPGPVVEEAKLEPMKPGQLKLFAAA